MNVQAVVNDPAKFVGAMRGLVVFSIGNRVSSPSAAATRPDSPSAFHAAGSALLTGLRGGLFSFAGARVVARLRLKLFTNLLRQEIDFFDKHDTGSLTSRLSADAAKLSNVVSYHVNIILRSAGG